MNRSIDELDTLLRAELSGVEACRIAQGVVVQAPVREVIERCLEAHIERVSLIRDRIERLGGQPMATSGVWSAFIELSKKKPDPATERAVLQLLHDGEKHGLDTYASAIEQLDSETRTFVEAALLPGQRWTQECIEDLHRELEPSEARHPLQ